MSDKIVKASSCRQILPLEFRGTNLLCVISDTIRALYYAQFNFPILTENSRNLFKFDWTLLIVFLRITVVLLK